MKPTWLVSAVGRLSTARVAGSRQPMSTIRAASAPPVAKRVRAARPRDDPLVGAQDVDDPDARRRAAGVGDREAAAVAGDRERGDGGSGDAGDSQLAHLFALDHEDARAPAASGRPATGRRTCRTTGAAGRCRRDRARTRDGGDPPSAAATKTALPLPETAAIRRGRLAHREAAHRVAGPPSGPSTGCPVGRARSTTGRRAGPTARASAVPPASNSGPAGHRGVDPAAGQRHGGTGDGDPDPLDPGHLAQRPGQLVDRARELVGRGLQHLPRQGHLGDAALGDHHGQVEVGARRAARSG